MTSLLNGVCAMVFADNVDDKEDCVCVVVDALSSNASSSLVSRSFDYCPLRLETRYYACNIQLRVFNNFDALDVWARRCGELSSEFFGVLIVCVQADRLNDNTLKQIQASVKQLAAESNVVLVDGDCTAYADAFAKLGAFCVENAIELIELKPDEECKAGLAEYGELGGLDRLREVVHCVDWPNSERKPNPTTQKSHRDYLHRVIADLDEETEEDVETTFQQQRKPGSSAEKTDRSESKSSDKLEDEPAVVGIAELMRQLKSLRNRNMAADREERLSVAERISCSLLAQLCAADSDNSDGDGNPLSSSTSSVSSSNAVDDSSLPTEAPAELMS